MQFLKKLFSKEPDVVRTDISSRFQLHGRVGQGSMSKVWRATDRQSGNSVALKVLDKEKTERLEQRFVGLDKPKEGEVTITLNHPNIIRTFDHGITSDDEQFLVMEFISGHSLSFLVDIQNEAMQTNCLKFCIDLGDALCYFHRRGYIHRDICPRNVLVDEQHNVKLIDFGLLVPDTAPFRAPGNRTGTANYMAPELIKRSKTDQRIDVFSYSVTCYEMYANKLPWPHGDTLESVVAHINNPPEDLRTYRPDIDDEIADIIMSGLARSPDDRPQTMQAMVDQFKQAGRRLGVYKG